jgi:hypothetical protein
MYAIILKKYPKLVEQSHQNYHLAYTNSKVNVSNYIGLKTIPSYEIKSHG